MIPTRVTNNDTDPGSSNSNDSTGVSNTTTDPGSTNTNDSTGVSNTTTDPGSTNTNDSTGVTTVSVRRTTSYLGEADATQTSASPDTTYSADVTLSSVIDPAIEDDIYVSVDIHHQSGWTTKPDKVYWEIYLYAGGTTDLWISMCSAVIMYPDYLDGTVLFYPLPVQLLSSIGDDITKLRLQWRPIGGSGTGSVHASSKVWKIGKHSHPTNESPHSHTISGDSHTHTTNESPHTHTISGDSHTHTTNEP